MRAGLTFPILIVAALCGYWFLGAHLFRQGVEDWFAAQQEEGRIAEAQGLEFGGFPARFAAASDTLMVMDPETGWGWQTPSAALSMPAWWPFRLRADLAERHVLDTPGGQFDVTAQDLGLNIDLSAGYAPVGLHVQGGAVQAVGADGTLRASSLQFDSVQEEEMVRLVTLSARGLGLEAGPLSLVDGTLAAEAEVTLAERLEDLPDAAAIPVERIVLRRAEMRFAQTAATASGTLIADARGFAAGELVLRLENWPEALEAAVAAGLIPENRVGLLEGGLRMMSDGNTLELPLTLAGGDIRFGPFPIGSAPRLR